MCSTRNAPFPLVMTPPFFWVSQWRYIIRPPTWRHFHTARRKKKLVTVTKKYFRDTISKRLFWSFNLVRARHIRIHHKFEEMNFFLQVWMKLCEDGNPMQLWERRRPSQKVYDETRIAGYQFFNRKYPHLCMDYSKIKRKGEKLISRIQ